jgi:hypothetical protein
VKAEATAMLRRVVTWVWRGIACAWLLMTVGCSATFGLAALPSTYRLHPLSLFERWDPETCPGYGERGEDDASLSACIHAARQGRGRWSATTAELHSLWWMAEIYLAPPFLPIAVWGAVFVFRRFRTRWRLQRDPLGPLLNPPLPRPPPLLRAPGTAIGRSCSRI